ncbi:MAG: aminoglycoside phosphotransferase family protein [Oscillospiraceae bacterium]|nr:aminoglycoside phosphotransferase family protein [Oscillospiraceae bacterium]
MNKKFGKNIINADYRVKQLYKVESGDVRLISGIAKTSGGERLTYKVVVKMQPKGEIPGESLCREYDLFMSDFDKVFNNTLRWAEYYHFEIESDAIQIWMEYIDGISGNALTIEMLEYIAEELGRFQGRLYKTPGILKNIGCFSDVGLIKRRYLQWNPETSEYQYIRSENCEIPEHLTQMLIDMDNNIENIFTNITKLPVVLCHRDFWIDNIFYVDGKIVLIDWDCIGWGYMGEDMAGLIADDITDMKYLDEYYHRFIPAYYKGISEYMDISAIDDNYIWEMILIEFGYRYVQRYMFAESTEYKNQQITALQKLYEIKRL